MRIVDLPITLRDKAMKNMETWIRENEADEKKYNGVYEGVITAFDWEYTEEGPVFWIRCNNGTFSETLLPKYRTPETTQKV